MTKINFRFTLLQARYPELYQEAKSKIEAGVKPGDVMGDWLKELEILRRMSTLSQGKGAELITAAETDDDAAIAIMDSL